VLIVFLITDVNQMDLLENEVMSDVVVLAVVLEEVKNKNLSIYNRLRTVIDNPLRHFYVFSNENHKYAFYRCTSHCIYKFIYSGVRTEKILLFKFYVLNMHMQGYVHKGIAKRDAE
jgi:hypothetical protein